VLLLILVVVVVVVVVAATVVATAAVGFVLVEVALLVVDSCYMEDVVICSKQTPKYSCLYYGAAVATWSNESVGRATGYALDGARIDPR
jgi:hypothetical protein